MTIPGLNAEVSIYQSTATYFTHSFSFGISTESVGVVQPQFRAKVQVKCKRCANGEYYCYSWGYECTVIKGPPGSRDLDIRPGEGRVSCQPETFREWGQPC